MNLTPETRIESLIKRYPFLLEFLPQISEKFKALKNPVMRKTVGKIATIRTAAKMGGIEVDVLLSKIASEIQKHAGDGMPVTENAVVSAGEELPKSGERQEKLKEIIRDLHQGQSVEKLKERFRNIIQGISAPEVAKMEQALMEEGMPAEEIKRLCDIHVDIFKEALKEQDRPEPPPGHPIHTFMKENRASEDIMSQINITIGSLGHPLKEQAFTEHKQELGSLIERLREINVHYTRKENQLFPMLEAHHFTGPSQVMWSIHDDIRAELKKAKDAFLEDKPDQTVASLKAAIQAIRDMIYKEEHILYPTSLDMLSEEEWIKVRDGEADIGFAWVVPDIGWPGEVREVDDTGIAKPSGVEKDTQGLLGLNTGSMSQAQINLMLTHLPVDLTFVDESDRVVYYSEGPERIFPRSPAVIGREVRNCHPPKSVHIVNKILDAFKSGDKDTAAFWIQPEGRFIYIRYFAVRDVSGRYRGTLEVSQDLTKIRELEGESRLLDWD